VTMGTEDGSRGRASWRKRIGGFLALVLALSGLGAVVLGSLGAAPPAPREGAGAAPTPARTPLPGSSGLARGLAVASRSLPQGMLTDSPAGAAKTKGLEESSTPGARRRVQNGLRSVARLPTSSAPQSPPNLLRPGKQPSSASVSPVSSVARPGSAAACPPACTREQLETGLVHPPAWAAGRHIHFMPASPADSPYAGARASRTGLRGPSNGAEEVTKVLGGPVFPSNNGTVQHTPTVHLILWGTNFNGGSGENEHKAAEIKAMLEELFSGLSNSAYQGILTQYFDSTSRVAPAINYSPESYVYAPAGEPAPTSVNGKKVDEAISGAINQKGWPVDINTQFVLVAAPGTTFEAGFMYHVCAYHGFIERGIENREKLVYDFDPYKCSSPESFVQNVSRVAVHEYSEAATDPRVGCGEGWRTAGCGAEVGDLCQSYPPSQELELAGHHHAWVQREYDDHLGGCAFEDLNPPHVLGLSEPPSKLGRHEATMNATVNAENEGLDTKYRFEFGPTTSYGNPPEGQGYVDVGNRPGNQQVHQTLTALPLEATVHYRVAATNSKNETTYGEDHTFTPSQWYPTNVALPPGTGQSSFGIGLYPSCSVGMIYPQVGTAACGSVSCPSAETCLAVGTYESESERELPMANTWDKGQWSAKALPYPEGGDEVALTSVSCVATNACFAVGYEKDTAGIRVPVADRMSGAGEWSVVPVSLPPGATEAALQGVSCTSSTRCVAVGVSMTCSSPPCSNGQGTQAPFAMLWSEGAWTLQELNPPVATQAGLESVSCPAEKSCVAVGFSEKNGALIDTWDGSTWSPVPAHPPPERGSFIWGLSSVSCSSTSACTAVGTYASSGGDAGLVERWNGQAWSLESAANTGHPEDLAGVSCAGPEECTAVGYYEPNGVWVPMVQTWNGSTWSTQPLNLDTPPVASELHAVSCASGGTCVAVGNSGWSAAGRSTTGPVYALAEIRSSKPYITSIEPANGGAGGGNAVTITGGNFAAPATVTIGNASLGNVSLRHTRLVVSRSGVVMIQLSCAGPSTCIGKLTLAIQTRPNHRNKPPRPMEIGGLSFTIKPGATATLRLRLSPAGRSILKAHRGPPPATLTIARESPPPAQKRLEKVTLAAAKVVKTRNRRR
jgi:hypothetical protein